MAKNHYTGSAKKKNQNQNETRQRSEEESIGGESPVTIMEIHEYLSGIEYPAAKDDLLDHAERQGAPVDVLDALNNIADKHYGVPADISEELASYK